MSKIKPSLPKGTRDFSPEQLARRYYILNIIRSVFEKYGYQPIETPAMENLSTLLGKYGEEGDKLLFRILNSGDYLSKADTEALEEKDSGKLANSITEKGLRYDLTIPFARYVVMHQHEITFPFKRYQIQPVWRADKPQKGRYREFYQCDADVIGSDSLLNEVELIQIYDEVFRKLGLKDISIKINNRKILEGIVELTGKSHKFNKIVTIVDKADKIGPDAVAKLLEEEGINKTNATDVWELLVQRVSYDLESQDHKYSNKDLINDLREKLNKSPIGMKGLAELEKIFDYIELNNIRFDITLARGLDYYTGTILEVTANNVSIGSIGGGGRYDDLTGVFGLKGISGVGISFGLDRIYDVMDELQLFENISTQPSQVLLVNFDPESEKYAFDFLQKLRAARISSELYPSQDKLGKQFKYADAKNIPFVVIAGSNEIKSGLLSLKNMKTGDQEKKTPEEIIDFLKKN